MRVAAENGALAIRGADRFNALGKGRYRAGEQDFVFGPDRVERRTPDGEATVYRRMTEAKPLAVDLAELIGAYSSPEASGVLVASVRGDALILTPADRPSAPVLARPLYQDAFLGDGQLIRVVRDADGKPAGLRFTNGRVYSLDFRRVN